MSSLRREPIPRGVPTACFTRSTGVPASAPARPRRARRKPEASGRSSPPEEGRRSVRVWTDHAMFSTIWPATSCPEHPALLVGEPGEPRPDPEVGASPAVPGREQLDPFARRHRGHALVDHVYRLQQPLERHRLGQHRRRAPLDTTRPPGPIIGSSDRHDVCSVAAQRRDGCQHAGLAPDVEVEHHDPGGGAKDPRPPGPGRPEPDRPVPPGSPELQRGQHGLGEEGQLVDHEHPCVSS